MANFKQFVLNTDFSEVWPVLSGERKEMDGYRESFEEMFRELQNTEPLAEGENMTIRFVVEADPMREFYFLLEEDAGETEADTGEPCLQVYGFKPGDGEGYAIGVRPADVLLGMEVDPETAETYSAAEIVAHVLEEMAYNFTVAASAYGTDKEMAGGGLYASQVCMEEDIQNVDLQKLREELGITPKEKSDMEKYGFLF